MPFDWNYTTFFHIHTRIRGASNRGICLRAATLSLVSRCLPFCLPDSALQSAAKGGVQKPQLSVVSNVCFLMIHCPCNPASFSLDPILLSVVCLTRDTVHIVLSVSFSPLSCRLGHGCQTRLAAPPLPHQQISTQ